MGQKRSKSWWRNTWMPPTILDSLLQRVFQHEHYFFLSILKNLVKWQVFWLAKLFNDGGLSTIAIWEWLFLINPQILFFISCLLLWHCLLSMPNFQWFLNQQKGICCFFDKITTTKQTPLVSFKNLWKIELEISGTMWWSAHHFNP